MSADLLLHAGSDSGRQISRQGFPTKKAAEVALNEVLKKAAQGTVVSKSSVRVREYLDDWLKSQGSRLRETTLRSYEIAVGRIVQRLGSVPLQSLTPLQIETFYAELLDDGGKSEPGLAAKTVRNTHVLLRLSLTRSGSDSCHAMPLLPRTHQQQGVPSSTPGRADDLKEFFAAIRDDRLFAAFVALATTEMRRSEVLGLRWRDVDLDAAQLALCSHSRLSTGSPLMTGPKTQRSRRPIFLDSQTVAVLKDRRRRQREEQLVAGPDWHTSADLVFEMSSDARSSGLVLQRVQGPRAPRWCTRDPPARFATTTMATTPTASVRMTRFVALGAHPASVGPVDLFAVGRSPQAGM